MTPRVARLAVSIGCPSGIGPEVSVRAARKVRDARVVLVGDLGVVRRAAKVSGVAPESFVPVASAREGFALGARLTGVVQPGSPLLARDAGPGHPSKAGGAAQLAWIDAATDLVAAGEADALVTGPVSKAAIAHSGAPSADVFRGHTEHLEMRLGAREVVMAFACETLTTALVTTHLPLSAVPRAITAEAVARATFWLADLCARLLPPRTVVKIAVASLNPHAGEGGLLGEEETRAIVPGIEEATRRARAAKLRVTISGPVPAESAFRLGARGAYDGVVAMYHDQATIPMKLLGFGDAVNVSLALPIVRTSVDHGTAYDIAGRGVADARGMLRAMELAVRLVAREASDGGASRTRRTPPRRGTGRTRSG
jgi:4-hydroxythreonine-4-phosphate dehydrogenase